MTQGKTLEWAALAAALTACATCPARAAEDKRVPDITDKTLVVWAAPASLTQRGGSALTLENGDDCFDAIVFGELAPARWMAGSNFFRRTHRQQDAWAAETADPEAFVQVAIVYEGKQIAIYRNGVRYADYSVGQPQAFGPQSFAVIGLRHVAAGDGACFAGAIEDARIYGVALTPEQLAALKPNQPSTPKPLAWWTFEDGKPAERMGAFPNTRLFGNARVVDGKLVLDGRGSYLVSARGEVPSWRGRVPAAGSDLIADARALRARLLADPHRPRYHFVSPEGICMPFDPNGAIFWRGRYHLMYIVQHGGHCWGHAVSHDLLHWTILPLALVPGHGDQGIFSGGAFVNKEGRPTIIYHGCGVGNCIAIARDDELIEWQKLPSNPIVPIPKKGEPGEGKYSSWDPHGWLEGETYYAIFGGGSPTLFKSSDLKHWEFQGPFVTDRKWIRGGDASCPDFFPLGDRHVFLFIAHDLGAQYCIGRWEKEKFAPESHGMMTWAGGRFFAPETLLDAKGRRILWGWVCEARTPAAQSAAGWGGVMSLPRVLSLAGDKTLRIEPIAELDRLRIKPRHRSEALGLDGDRPLEDAKGDCLEIALEIEPGAARQVGLRVRRSPAGEEETVIAFDPAAKMLRLDVSRSSLSTDVRYGWPSPFNVTGGSDERVQKAPLELREGEALKLRVFLDRSIVEVFANGRQCVTQRIYPSRGDALGVSLFSLGGMAKVRSLDIWEMAATNAW